MSKRIRWLLALCMAVDLGVLLVFWAPDLLGYEFAGWLGRIQTQVASVASPLLVPALIVLFVLVAIREDPAP